MNLKSIAICLSITIALLAGITASVQSSQSASLYQNAVSLAFTTRDTAKLGHDRIDSVIIDHYGNPENFKSYIISLPAIRV